MEWGDRRIRQLLRKVAAPSDVHDDELAHSLRRLTGASSEREAVRVVADRALREYPPLYGEIVRRVDFNGESSKTVADDLHLSERTFFRHRRAAISVIAAEIATLTGDSLPRGVGEVGLDALALYARGRYLWKQRTGASLERAKQYFDRALDLAPNFALAHSGIADVHVRTGQAGLRDASEAFADAHASLDRAFALDVQLPEAHTTLADLYLSERRDRRRAHESLDTALAIDPNYTTAHQFAAFLAFCETDLATAFDHVRTALAREPNSLELQTTLGIVLRFEGKTEHAIDHLSDIVGLDANFAFARYELSRTLIGAGRYDDALEHLWMLLETEPRFTYEAMIAYVEALRGDGERARRLTADRDARSREMPSPHYMTAWLHVALDDHDAAFEQLGAALAANEPWVIYVPVDPFFGRLRGDPRFDRLVETVKEAAPFPLAS
jgi:tetratricopeptide (TPR) repeat protein